MNADDRAQLRTLKSFKKTFGENEMPDRDKARLKELDSKQQRGKS